MPQAPDPVPRPLDHLAERGRDEAAALVLRGETLSWKDLRSRVAKLAGWLAERLEPGARVATWAAKGELTCLMPLAAARAGLVHVPANPLLKRAQVAHIVADSGARLLIGTAARLATLELADLPSDCDVIAEDEAMAMVAASNRSLAASSADPDSLAALLYTSGSTGRPKGVMLSHANIWLGAVSVASYLRLAEDDVTLAVLPLSFDYGQNQLLSAWYAGGCAVPLDYLTPRDGTGWQAWGLNASAPNTASLRWGLESINAPHAWGCEQGTSATKVAIVDSRDMPYSQDLDGTVDLTFPPSEVQLR